MFKKIVVFLLLLLSMTFLISHENVQITEVETVIDTDIVLNALDSGREPFDPVRTCRRRRCTCWGNTFFAIFEIKSWLKSRVIFNGTKKKVII